MQLETAASAFVCGLVRKDVRACPIVARLAAPDHPFHALAVPPGPLVVVGRSDLVREGRCPGGVENTVARHETSSTSGRPTPTQAFLVSRAH
jgi:hypothetical protein